MVNYGYECRGWTQIEKAILAVSLKKVWADVEIDQLYPGVRLRRLRNPDRAPMSDEEIDKIASLSDIVFNRISAKFSKPGCV